MKINNAEKQKPAAMVMTYVNNDKKGSYRIYSKY